MPAPMYERGLDRNDVRSRQPLVIDIADIEAPPDTSIGEFDYVPIDRRERCRLRLRVARGRNGTRSR